MYRKACPIALCALAVALVVSRRRLNEAQAELRLLRVAARARGDRPSERIAQNAALPREEETKEPGAGRRVRAGTGRGFLGVGAGRSANGQLRAVGRRGTLAAATYFASVRPIA